MIKPSQITKLIRTVDLRNCLLCHTCEKSCAGRHGYQRNVREGIKIGQIVLPYACKQCVDPQCISSCKKGAIKRGNETETLYLDKEACIGCGLCAKKCPFGSILMEETGKFREIKDKDGNIKKNPIRYANRCDLCRGKKKRGCFTNCPRGTLKMLPFNKVLLSLPPIHQEKLKRLFLNEYWIKDEEKVNGERIENEQEKIAVGV